MIPSSQPKSHSGTDPSALISRQVERINADFRLHPVTASEIEFFLLNTEQCPTLEGFWADIAAFCEKEGITIDKCGSETTRDQFEISLKPCDDPVKTARDTIMLRDIIRTVSGAHGIPADFSAKPFADRPGSGLHIHVHLMDTRANKNVFYKDDESISAMLQYSIGGLMTWLNPCMPVFAPTAESYERFTPKSMAPLTVSWGANNRTVAIRLPDAAHDNKHIEHRVPGADADPERVLAVILAAIHFGIKNQCNPGGQIYGDASLPMYNLPPIVSSLKEAMDRFHESTLFDDYFSFSEDLLLSH